MTTSPANAKRVSRSTTRDQADPRRWHESGQRPDAAEDLDSTRRDVHQVLVAARPDGEVDDPATWLRYRLIWPHVTPSSVMWSEQEPVRQLLIDRVRNGSTARNTDIGITCRASPDRSHPAPRPPGRALSRTGRGPIQSATANRRTAPIAAATSSPHDSAAAVSGPAPPTTFAIVHPLHRGRSLISAAAQRPPAATPRPR